MLFECALFILVVVGMASGMSSPYRQGPVSPAHSPQATFRPARDESRTTLPYGAAFDNPDLIVTCVAGDGEAETGCGHRGSLVSVLAA